MASTYSTSLRLELIATGEQNGTWGTTTNTNLGTLLEQAIGGYVNVTHDDTASYTLTASNGASDEARNMVVRVSGTLAAARNVVVPTAEKIFLVHNNTTGGFKITVKTAAGTGVDIPNGKKSWVYCDGTNVLEGINALSSNLVLYDATDSTKRAQFVLSGISTATTRSYTLPDASVTLAGTNDVQTRIAGWAAGAGTVDAITATFTPTITALTDGMMLAVRASGANTSISPTFSPDGLTARIIYKAGGLALNIGDIRGAGHEMLLIYRASATRWELLNPQHPDGYVVKAAAEQVNNSTTLQDDDHLFFAVAANTDYEFEFKLFLNISDIAADFKYQLTGPAAPNVIFIQSSLYASTGGTAPEVSTAFSSPISHAFTTATVGLIKITGLLQNGVNTGTVQLQWAQNTATAVNTIVRKGSTLRYGIV